MPSSVDGKAVLSASVGIFGLPDAIMQLFVTDAVSLPGCIIHS